MRPLPLHTAVLPVETQLIVPFFKNVVLDLGWGYVVLTYFVIVGSSNAVNLTDGLDGLAILPTVMVAGALGIFAYVTGHANFSGYLGFPHIAGVGEVVVLCGSIVGAGLGFLWFNTYPAQVFMGDVGALALGAALGIVAVLVRQELVLLIMGGVFVMETVSVILQVASFKLTGKRLFRMAPLHHHFELKGWPEPRVIVRFWVITVVSSWSDCRRSSFGDGGMNAHQTIDAAGLPGEARAVGPAGHVLVVGLGATGLSCVRHLAGPGRPDGPTRRIVAVTRASIRPWGRGRVGIPRGRDPVRRLRSTGVRHRGGDRRQPGRIGAGAGIAGGGGARRADRRRHRALRRAVDAPVVAITGSNGEEHRDVAGNGHGAKRRSAGGERGQPRARRRCRCCEADTSCTCWSSRASSSRRPARCARRRARC